MLQLLTALILTALYAVLQMIVLIGIIIQMVDQGWCSPNHHVFFYVAGIFLLAALLHPQESFCVCHGFIHFLAIPSMHMLLPIYSNCNLHVVSWGTRESPKSQAEIEREEEKAQADPQGKLEEGEDKTKTSPPPKTTTKGTKWTCGTLSSCLCCTGAVPFEDDPAVIKMKSMLEERDAKIDEISQLLVDLDEKLSKIICAYGRNSYDGGAGPSALGHRRRHCKLNKRRATKSVKGSSFFPYYSINKQSLNGEW